MTKTKSTKRALLLSALSLLMCVSMLIGSTFAWFTDSVTSSGNIIKSGTLDVEMEWKDATATGAQQTYKDASEGAIFNYDKWEPGYVEAKNIKISNVGTLALKYNLNIAANGEESELADVIDVYFAEGEYTLTSRAMTELTKVGTLSDILNGMPANMAGDLKANTADTVTIALKMQEDAGNKYQGLSIGSDFSVVLMATQDNVEKDSFDENYDDIDVPDKDIKVIDGNTYYYLNDGNVVLRSVPYGNVGSSFTVRNDVTLLGIGVDKGDTNGPVFSKYSPVETLTLNEGLVKINARAVTGVKTLTSVNFPSTLKFIGEQAFAQAGMTSLTIPANVEEIKFGAFRDMANLTTVTVEGNVAFDDYAFRSCPNLTSIYLLGDDVTFTSSQFATHSDNGDATGITIYVKNTTVAARVYAAQTSAYGYEVKVLGEAADGSDAVSVTQVKNATDLETAVANGGDVVMANDVTLTGKVITTNGITEAYGNTVGVAQYGGTLDGNGNSLTETGAYAYVIVTHGGTIKNINIVGGGRGIVTYNPTENIYIDNVVVDGPGYALNSTEQKPVDMFVTNSTIRGWTSLAGFNSVNFTGCKFGENSAKYWQGMGYGQDYDRLFKVYSKTLFENCEFEQGYYLDLSAGGTLTLTNCTVNGVKITAENYANYVTIELPAGKTLADCATFN